MTNPPSIQLQVPNYLLHVALPKHATVLRSLCESCQFYAKQYNSVKVPLITFLFLAATTYVIIKSFTQISGLKRQIINLNNQIDQKNSDLKAKTTAIEEFRARETQKNQEIAALEQTLKEKEAERAAQSTERDVLRGQILSLRDHAERLQIQLAVFTKAQENFAFENGVRAAQEVARKQREAQMQMSLVQSQTYTPSEVSTELPIEIGEEIVQKEVDEHSFWEKPIEAGMKAIQESSFGRTLSYLYTFVKDTVVSEVSYACVEGNAPWKNHRYDLYTKHHKVFLDFVAGLNKRFPNPSRIEKEIIGKFESVAQELRKLKAAKKDPRAIHAAFVILPRPALDQLLRNDPTRPHVFEKAISEDFFKYVLENWNNRFLTNYMHTHYQKLVFWMARSKYPDLDQQLEQLSFADKMELVWKGVKGADPSLKSPTLNVTMKKLEAIKPTYDPALNNFPSIIGTAIYRHKESGQIKKVSLMRTHVPICGILSNASSKEWWQLEDQMLSPEFLAQCYALEKQNKNMLLVLHTDPSKLEEPNENQPQLSWLQKAWAHAQDWELERKRREALWTNLERNLGQFRKNVYVALFPYDHPWIKALGKGPPSKKDTFVKDLKKFLTASNSPFKLPSFVWSLDDNKNGKKNVQEERAFIEKIVDEVCVFYFSKQEELTGGQRMAFLNQFYARAAEHLRFKHNIAVQVEHCKDGVDRTMAAVGGQVADAVNRTGNIKDPALQAKVIGTTQGPALANVKREMIHSRHEFAVENVRHLETVPGAKPPAIEGYELVEFDFHEDPTQELTPPDNSPSGSPSSQRSGSPLAVSSGSLSD